MCVLTQQVNGPNMSQFNLFEIFFFLEPILIFRNLVLVQSLCLSSRLVTSAVFFFANRTLKGLTFQRFRCFCLFSIWNKILHEASSFYSLAGSSVCVASLGFKNCSSFGQCMNAHLVFLLSSFANIYIFSKILRQILGCSFEKKIHYF